MLQNQSVAAVMALVRSLICNIPLSEEIKSILPNEKIQHEIYHLSKKHDLAHLVAYELDRQQIKFSPEIEPLLRKQQMLAVYRHELLSHDQNLLYQALEDAKIPFLPLKGAVLRPFYPEPWMRTSSDIDVLAKKEDLERAAKVLSERLGCKEEKKSIHDISFFTPAGTHIELHYNLQQIDLQPIEILDSVWELAQTKDGSCYHYELPDPVFFLYHIVHMLAHFLNGGCGIRPFLDLWIIENRFPKNEEQRNALLAENGFLTFANAARNLSEVWFSAQNHNDLSFSFEQYILCGGVYGNISNRILAKTAKKKSKLRYILSRIFLSRAQLQNLFPALEKHPFLLPFYQIHRWLSFLFGNHKKLKNAKKELAALYNSGDSADFLIAQLDIPFSSKK